MSSPTSDPASVLRELRHEVGNALTAAAAHTQFLLRRLPAEAEPQEQQALVAIQDSLLRAGRLLRPGPTDFPPTRCDLHSLVALAISQVPPERTADLHVNVNTGIPLIGCGHPERIVQVLTNLLDNAVKYSLPGTPIAIEAYWLCDGTSNWALISVSDEGFGIDPEVIETVFAGHRTAAACRTASGSGVGLELSRRLMEAEGGKLWATSIPGRGSHFYATLPLAGAEATEPAGNDQPASLESCPPQAATLTSVAKHPAAVG